MKRQRWLRAVLTLGFALALITSLGLSPAAAFSDGDGGAAQPSLTEKQQKDLGKMYHKLFVQHAKIIEKYCEYGVISESEKDKKLAWLLAKEEKLKQNGYLWPCRDHKKKEEKPLLPEGGKSGTPSLK